MKVEVCPHVVGASTAPGSSDPVAGVGSTAVSRDEPGAVEISNAFCTALDFVGLACLVGAAGDLLDLFGLNDEPRLQAAHFEYFQVFLLAGVAGLLVARCIEVAKRLRDEARAYRPMVDAPPYEG